MTRPPQPGRPASTDLALGWRWGGAQPRRERLDTVRRNESGKRSWPSGGGPRGHRPQRGAGHGEQGGCRHRPRPRRWKWSAGRRRPRGPMGARGRGSVAARGAHPAQRSRVCYAALCMEPCRAPGQVRGPPRGACPGEWQPLCPLAATLGFKVQRAAPSCAVHRRRVRNKPRSGLQTLSWQKSSETQVHVVCAPASHCGQRPWPRRWDRRPAWLAPGRERLSLRPHGGASPPGISSHARGHPERSHAALVPDCSKVAIGGFRKGRPPPPRGPFVSRGWPGAVPASYLAGCRTHVPFSSCLVCSARPKAHPPPPSDP